MKKPTLAQYRKAAKTRYHVEGEVEIDPKAPVSRVYRNGAYVQAWVWVYNEDATDED